VPETPRERAAPAGTPASTLLASVDQAIADGDLERAAAVSERALRISPRDAYLWYRLASIRYQQQRYGEAEGFARRALSFAGNDGDLSREINNLLGQISQR
jgi:Flp pilus assembly protein TadD